jgi:hypothetical protein
MRIRAYYKVFFCVVCLFLLFPSTSLAAHNYLPEYSESFLKFFKWMEDQVMKRPAADVDPYELHKVMGYVLRKQMEKHHVFDEAQRSDDDFAALDVLNGIRDQYAVYVTEMAKQWNEQDPSYDADEYKGIFWRYFNSAFRGTDYDQGEGFDFERYMFEKWGIDPGSLATFVDFSGGGPCDTPNDRGYEAFLGNWTLEENYTGDRWMKTGISLGSELSPDCYGRKGEYLPAQAIWWLWVPDKRIMEFRDYQGNLVTTFREDGGYLTGQVINTATGNNMQARMMKRRNPSP